MSNFQLNKDGYWSMAVPLPLYTHSWFRPRYQCQCGLKFKKESEYRTHYETKHTDGNRYTRTPKGLTVTPLMKARQRNE